MASAGKAVIELSVNINVVLTRELERRGVVIEAVQLWRKSRGDTYSEKLFANARLRQAIDHYTREAQRRQEASGD